LIGEKVVILDATLSGTDRDRPSSRMFKPLCWLIAKKVKPA
jgi:hypothetical protein